MGQKMEDGMLVDSNGSGSVRYPFSLSGSDCRRKPWGTRRRTRSAGSLPFKWHHKNSDDSSSSVGGEWNMNFVRSKDKSGISGQVHQSDSTDEVSGMQCGASSKYFSLQSHLAVGNLESDSVNENFSPIRPNTRRKRKFKRVAVDIEMGSASSPRSSVFSCLPSSFLTSRKKRALRHNCENRLCGSFLGAAGCTGKRKRNSRAELNLRKSDIGSPPRVLALQRLSLKDELPPSRATKNEPSSDLPMDTCSSILMTATPAPSSSSLSSSESDTGIFTNDEGREGDDEQSDWFGDVAGAVGGNRLANLVDDSDRDEEMDSTFQQAFDFSSPNSFNREEQMNRICRFNNESLAVRGGREIRGGRRRVRSDKPSFSVLTSANEKLSRFLQDPGQSELKLHPMQKNERDQLGCLAELYSLNMKLTESSKKGLTCPVLTKTSNTVRVERVSLGKLDRTSDHKKRRKSPTVGLFTAPINTAACDNRTSSGGSETSQNNAAYFYPPATIATDQVMRLLMTPPPTTSLAPLNNDVMDCASSTDLRHPSMD